MLIVATVPETETIAPNDCVFLYTIANLPLVSVDHPYTASPVAVAEVPSVNAVPDTLIGAAVTVPIAPINKQVDVFTSARVPPFPDDPLMVNSLPMVGVVPDTVIAKAFVVDVVT